MQQGFNRSFCGKHNTLYGKGVYFARDASYSTYPLYCTPDAKDVQTVFLVRVVATCAQINQCVGSDANMNQGTVKFDFCTGRGRVLQGHQARGDARHAQRVEEPALRLDRRQCQRSEHLRDIPRRASVPRVGARRPRIASTASRRGREHRVASSVDRIDEGRGRGADPRTPSP